MSIEDRKKMIVNAIRKLEDQMVRIQYCETDCDQSLHQRDLELDALKRHRFSALELLVALNEEELQEVA